MKTGDEIIFEYEGRTYEGVIAIASSNQVSLMLAADDGLIKVGENYVNMLPAMLGDDGVYRDLFARNPIRFLERDT